MQLNFVELDEDVLEPEDDAEFEDDADAGIDIIANRVNFFSLS